MKAPWLMLAFALNLVALVVVTIASGVDAAKTLDLHLIALAIGSAIAGAHLPSSGR